MPIPTPHRAPVLNKHLFSACKTADQAKTVAQCLTAGLLTPEEAGMNWGAKITAIEDKLSKRIPSLEQATRPDEDGNYPSALEIAKAISSEAASLAAQHNSSSSHKRSNATSEGDSSLALNETAIQEALHSKAFKECEDNCTHLDMSTTEGRRAYIEEGFMSNCAIIIKVLLRASKDLARRHTLLAAMLEARGGQGISGLIDYFSHAHAVDPTTGEVPQRRRKYSVAGEAGTYEIEMRKFIQCKFHEVDWYCTATGIYALRMCDTGGKLSPIDKRDWFGLPTELEDLIDFGKVRMTAAGFPTQPETDKEGYTWESFWKKYIAHLKLAKRATTRQEMSAWVHQTDVQGRAAIRIMGETYERFINTSCPATAKLGWILPADCPPILAIESRERALATLHEHRDLYHWLGTPQGANTTLHTDTLPRLSDPATLRSLDSNSPYRKRQKTNRRGLTPTRSNPPRARWLSAGRKLLCAGYVWDAIALRAAYPRTCIEFIACDLDPQDAQKECPYQHQPGHTHPGDTAHTPPLPFEELRRRFAKPYDPTHTPSQQRSPQPPTPNPNQGGKGGRGGRGRGGGRGSIQPQAGRGGRGRTAPSTRAGAGPTGTGTAANASANVGGAAKEAKQQGAPMRGGSSAKASPRCLPAQQVEEHLPMAAAEPHEVSDPTTLHPLLQKISAVIAPLGEAIADCSCDVPQPPQSAREDAWSGVGTCGDNATAASLHKLGQPYAPQVIRLMIIAEAGSEAIYSTFSENGKSLAEAVADSLRSWPKTELKAALAAVGEPSPSATRDQELRRLVTAWRLAMLKASTFTDEAYYVLLASLFRIQVVAYIISEQGMNMPRVINPPQGINPEAVVKYAVVANDHVTAVFHVSTETALRLRTSKTTTNSIHARCAHGWTLLKGGFDRSVVPRCARTECHKSARMQYNYLNSPTPSSASASARQPEARHAVHAINLSGKLGAMAIGCEHAKWVWMSGQPNEDMSYCNDESCRYKINIYWINNKRQFCAPIDERSLPTRMQIAEMQRTYVGNQDFRSQSMDVAYALTSKVLPTQHSTEPVTAEEIYHARNDSAMMTSLRKRIALHGSSPPYLATHEAQDEFNALRLPLQSIEDVKQLLSAKHIAPTELIGFEFSAAMRTTRETAGAIALSCDLRQSEIFGLHAQMDVRELMDITEWERAYMHPPCTHQVRADIDTLKFKLKDGRALFGCLMVLRSMYVRAKAVIVEQPDVIFHEIAAAQGLVTPEMILELRTTNVNDWPDKFIRLIVIRGKLDDTLLPANRDTRRPTIDTRKHISQYRSSDERDRTRSSFKPFHNLCKLLSSLQPNDEPALRPATYEEACELLAVEFHKRGYPVMKGYDDPYARPPPEQQDYQFMRGVGDGRIPEAVIPASLLRSYDLRGGGNKHRKPEPLLSVPKSLNASANLGVTASRGLDMKTASEQWERLEYNCQLAEASLASRLIRTACELRVPYNAQSVKSLEDVIGQLECVENIGMHLGYSEAEIRRTFTIPLEHAYITAPTSQPEPRLPFRGGCRQHPSAKQAEPSKHTLVAAKAFAPGTQVVAMRNTTMALTHRLVGKGIPHVRLQGSQIAVYDAAKVKGSWILMSKSKQANVSAMLIGDPTAAGNRSIILVWVANRWILDGEAITRNVYERAAHGIGAMARMSLLASLNKCGGATGARVVARGYIPTPVGIAAEQRRGSGRSGGCSGKRARRWEATQRAAKESRAEAAASWRKQPSARQAPDNNEDAPMKASEVQTPPFAVRDDGLQKDSGAGTTTRSKAECLNSVVRALLEQAASHNLSPARTPYDWPQGYAPSSYQPGIPPVTPCSTTPMWPPCRPPGLHPMGLTPTVMGTSADTSNQGGELIHSAGESTCFRVPLRGGNRPRQGGSDNPITIDLSRLSISNEEAGSPKSATSSNKASTANAPASSGPVDDNHYSNLATAPDENKHLAEWLQQVVAGDDSIDASGYNDEIVLCQELLPFRGGGNFDLNEPYTDDNDDDRVDDSNLAKALAQWHPSDDAKNCARQNPVTYAAQVAADDKMHTPKDRSSPTTTLLTCEEHLSDEEKENRDLQQKKLTSHTLRGGARHSRPHGNPTPTTHTKPQKGPKRMQARSKHVSGEDREIIDILSNQRSPEWYDNEQEESIQEDLPPDMELEAMLESAKAQLPPEQPACITQRMVECSSHLSIRSDHPLGAKPHLHKIIAKIRGAGTDGTQTNRKRSRAASPPTPPPPPPSPTQPPQPPSPPHTPPPEPYDPSSPPVTPPSPDTPPPATPLCWQRREPIWYDQLIDRPALPTAARSPNEDLPVLDFPLANLEQWLAGVHRTILDSNCEDGQCGPEAIACSLRRLGWDITAKQLRRQVARAAVYNDCIREKTICLADVNTSVKDLICASAYASAFGEYHLRNIEAQISRMGDLSFEEMQEKRTDMFIELWAEHLGDTSTGIDAAFIIIVCLLLNIEVHVLTIDEHSEQAPEATCFAPPTPTSPPASARVELACIAEKHFAAILSNLREETEDSAREPECQESLAVNGTPENGVPREEQAQDNDINANDTVEDEASDTSALTTVRGRNARRAPTMDVRRATRSSVMLLLLGASTAAHWAQPLVYAHTNGYTIIGAEFPQRMIRSACLSMAQVWTKAIAPVGTLASLVGEGATGERLCAAPIASNSLTPLCTTRAARLALNANGIEYAWCSLQALQDTALSEIAARAILVMQAFIRPIKMASHLAAYSDATFHSGAAAAQPLQAREQAPFMSAADSEQAAAHTRHDDARLIKELDEHNEDGLINGWADVVSPINIDEVPTALRFSLPSHDDTTLEHLPLARIPPPIHSNWIPLPPQQMTAPDDAPACVHSVWDMLDAEAQAKTQRWLNESHKDLLNVRAKLSQGTAPHAIIRHRPTPIAVGQSELRAWARDRVWDCRKLHSTCCHVADFHAPIDSGLNRDLLQSLLANYPDQALVAHLLEGVRLEADVELQTVLVPHLLSISQGLPSVAAEILRMHGLAWYEFYDQIPFWPMYMNAQGSTPRKLEPDRFRRTTEGGGPRKETYDREGIPAISLNEAARKYYIPRHFLTDTRKATKEWLVARGLPRPESEAPLSASQSKWPREKKPLLAEILRDLAILKRAAVILNLPIYVFSDDFADYFSNLPMAASELHKMGIQFIHPADMPKTIPNPATIYIVEKRLGFGMHGASNVAQRFSDAILHILRQELDASETATFAKMDKNNAWHAARASLCAKDEAESNVMGAHSAATHTEKWCAHQRLYSVRIFTDDALFIVVGADRAVSVLRAWRKLVKAIGVQMAKKEKRHMGSHATWLGVIIIAPLAICIIPRVKLMRAAHAIRQTLLGHASFAEYRSLCGLLEHLRAITLHGRNAMFGLYEPHGPQGESASGPDTKIRCSPLMRKQLQKWLRSLAKAGGVSARQTILKAEYAPTPSLIFALCSDACLGDTDTPGIGGFCHGMYWYMKIPSNHTPVVNTPLLEFLAVCGNIITFYPYLAGIIGEEVAVLLRTDALTTALTLPHAKQKSPLMMQAYMQLQVCHEFKHLSKYAYISHIYGDTNALSDRISRAKWNEFHQLCGQLQITPQRLPTPPRFTRMYLNVIAFATRHITGRGKSTLLQRLNSSSESARRDTNNAHATPPRETTQAASSSALISFKPTKREESRLDGEEAPQLRLASKQAASQALLQLAADGPPSMQLRAPPPVIRQAAALTEDLVSSGINERTALKDERAFKLWKETCKHFATSAVRTAQDVRENPERIVFLLTALMVLAKLTCKAKKGGGSFIKPKSCLAYPLAIMRIYKRWGIALPGIGKIKACLQGMCKQYIAHHGPHSITPKKAEPMKFKMAQDIFDLTQPSRESTPSYHQQRRTFMLKRANLFAMSSGARLAAIAKPGATPAPAKAYNRSGQHRACYDNNETSRNAQENLRTWLQRDDASYTINNVVLTDPSERDLKSMKKGDSVTIRPIRAKCDQWVELYAPFPWVFTFDDNPHNVARAFRDIEIEYPCHGSDRSCTALFGDEHGNPYPHDSYMAFLKDALTRLYGPKVASLYTWHSYRAGLATALHAAGIADEVIMLICHWKSPESLRSYRRLSQQEYASALTAAATVPITLLQPRNAPIVCEDHHYAELLNDLQEPRPPAASKRSAPATSTERSPTGSAAKRAKVRPSQNVNGASSPAGPIYAWHPVGQELEAGALVLVKREAWPKYPCKEQGGMGWLARVKSATSKSAVVEFSNARTKDGRTYEDARVLKSMLMHAQGTLRGGCNTRITRDETYCAPVAGPLNENGYPQLVPNNKCALCKQTLEPLTMGTRNWNGRAPPTRIATPERLQCERCARVRYCSAWCAHIHYWACHQYVCPIPRFNTAYNAEYIIRTGHAVIALPVHCIDAQLLDNGTYKTSERLQARAHMWSSVAHKGTRLKPLACTWCTNKVTPHTSEERHDVWFVGLITRIRATPQVRWPHEPRWRPPLLIYASHPTLPGDAKNNWPLTHPRARFGKRSSIACDPTERERDDVRGRTSSGGTPAAVALAQDAPAAAPPAANNQQS